MAMAVSQPELMMSAEGYAAAAAVLVVTLVAGVLLNVFAFLYMWKIITPMYSFYLNMIAIDLIVAMFGTPVALSAAINRGWYLGSTACTAYGFFMTLMGMVSVGTLTLLAFRLQHIVVQAGAGPRPLSYARVALELAGVWLYALALAGPPLLGWGQYVNEAANISCSVNWEQRDLATTCYILYLFLFGMVGPSIIQVLSYCRICLHIRNVRNRDRAHEVTCTVAVLSATFAAAWLPYSVFALLAQFGPEGLISPALATAPAILAKTSICYDPIIYRFFMPAFQRRIRARRQNAVAGAGERIAMNPVRTISSAL